MYCKYFQAQVVKKDCWFLVANLRSFEHLAFDRTYDKINCIFEFFVPEHNVPDFIKLMNYFLDQKVVINFKEMPNRLFDPNETV